MVVESPEPLPVVRVDQILREAHAQRWLVEPLWGESSVGVIGGAPRAIARYWVIWDTLATASPAVGL